MRAMAKTKTTVYVDDDLLRTVRVMAARSGRRDSEVFEEALRRYVGLDVLERVWARSDLGEDEAMRIAVEEVHAMRRERDPRSS